MAQWHKRVWVFPMLMTLSAASQAAFVYEADEPFSRYIERAERHLIAHKVWINEEDKARELAAVMPFELLPDAEQCAQTPSVGVLLSHGLSDSPFSMRDTAYALQQACYQVRVVLLPGHGTRAEDLLDVTRDDWRDTFRHGANKFSQEVDTLYVGGFSTGGALATEYAWQHEDSVAGAVLFAPAFKVNSGIDWLSPWLALVKDWLDKEPSDDFAKYASIPVPAIAEIYHLAKEVRTEVTDNPKHVPVFIALSDEDQTVDSSVSQEVFDTGMISENSQMVIYSQSQENIKTARLSVHNSHWPDEQILGLSHMAIHGHPNNPYYGATGEYRICGWYLSDATQYQACRTDTNNWFGERSIALTEKSPHAARVSWNPHFDELMQEVTIFLQTNINK
ncbi:alpha/beta fold hydrolase [Marinomonas sp. A79]|uniref:Alpha/beta fold hydrolase n=2 Tax=Marinomonas vulgaris TaxID=2823372 RepID=A0ABS5HD12_9GAMM|nr:alpha/beta fold hydrolase [Marinomonas vulgaris]